MLSRVGLNTWKYANRCAFPRTFRSITTKTTITEHTTGRVIKLTDPDQPEMGDYENVKGVLSQDKDPYAKYDDQQNRRNFNEPLNVDADMYDMWSPDYFNFVSDGTALKHNAIFFSLVFGFGALIWYFQLNPEKPAMPRSYPFGGLAKELGSGEEKTDFFYRVRPDLSAESELGFLPKESDVEKNKEEYTKANADFIQA